MPASDTATISGSARRTFIVEQLAAVLPNSHTELASNSASSKAKFKEWTGVTQEMLTVAWGNEHFNKQGSGSWVHDDRYAGNGVFTSCEGLILTMFNKLTTNGFGKPKGGATAFNLAGNVNGQEKGKAPAGWHWFRDKAPGNTPAAGDMFQTATPSGPGKWMHQHVGIITRWDDGEFPKWEVVHAGQGGPTMGYDRMNRKEYGLVFPLDRKHPRLEIMGWLNIDEYFG